jgi:NAD(P)-dependent dehydrogenase (short-subunit alcohol dehydrogenase family)
MTSLPTASSSASLDGAKVLVVGGSSGIAVEIARQAVAAGAQVTLAGRDLDRTRTATEPLGPAVTAATVDLGDEATIQALAEDLGEVDHVVNLASNPAIGAVQDLERSAVVAAFDAKVIGPLLLAKHIAPQMRPTGSLLLFSGIAAWRPAPDLSVMATANGAVSFLAAALAVELAPIRVNALSPGIVDSGAWDGMGTDDKEAHFAATAAANPARRVGQPADIASAALLALTNPFITGTTLHVDGGGRLS